MRRAVVLASMLAAPAAAQDHSMHDMPGMAMPAEAPPPHGHHGDHAMPATTPAVGYTNAGTDALPKAGTDLPAGDAPAPPVPIDHFADRDFPVAAMDRARATMEHEGGGRLFYQVMFNLAEVQVRDGARDGFRWDGQAWFGGDIDRLTLRTEGGGDFRGGAEDAEVQALYSRAIGPYFNLQGGIRQDFEPGPRRTYATAGIEGLAPYWFQTEARLFLSTRGELLGRLEGWYDQRLTQRLVLQPRVELNFAAQDIRSRGVGAGLSDAELGLRLRYEIAREYAPYVGVSYDARTGATARFARTAGERADTVSLVSGIRFWF